ncbi:hypothetical protein ACFL34_04290, partial [Candidatus Sumerlaeota bacterium]
MNASKSKMLERIKNYTSAKVIRDLKAGDRSPLDYAFRALKGCTDANDFDHSYRVFLNCTAAANKAGLELSKADYLILFYASLLHDIAKSCDKEGKEDILGLLSRKKPLFSSESCDHGIRSAHYVYHRQKDRLKFFGLGDNQIRLLCSVVAFHSSAILHAHHPFTGREVCRHDVLMCLLFWVADVADGVCDRAMAPATVQKKNMSEKTDARKEIKKVSMQKDAIVWTVNSTTRNVKNAAKFANEELSKHRVLLQAFGLPSEIVVAKSGVVHKQKPTISARELALSGLSLDVAGREVPLQISADNLSEAYESIVEAFQNTVAKGRPTSQHYFGPALIEVKNIDGHDDEAIHIRNDRTHLEIADIVGYTKQWLDKGPKAADNFYFGYTHGQRLRRYAYARTSDDPNSKDFFDWKGQIDQIKSATKLLKQEQQDARRAYAVIAHPVVDDTESVFYKKEIVKPALLAVHFRVERGDRLSAFAFLRSQEMSSF